MVGVCFWISSMVLLFSSVSVAKSKTGKACQNLNTFVDCDGKGLKVVPKNLPQWTNHLNINNNKLTAIEPLTFKNLEDLQVLNLKNNEINTLNDGAFYGLKNIVKLNLDNNHVTVITKGWLYGLNSLNRLSLSHNWINQIHKDAWEFCSNLTMLNLSYNKLDFIREETFKSLNNLQKLVLSNNKIANIMDNSFVHLPKLKKLYLNYNKISWMIEDSKGVFQGMGELDKIYLVGNNIKSINSDAFLGLRNVTYINLAENNITSIHNNTFVKVPQLKQLIINSQSMLCDCNLKWFLEWIKSKKFDVQASCVYPLALQGQSISAISMANLTCDELPKPRLIDEPPLEIMALKGANVTLNCTAVSSSSGNMSFMWKKDNMELLNSNAIIKSKVDSDGRTIEMISHLELISVEHSHAGKYQCVISNVYGTTYSRKSTVSVVVFPTFLKKPKNVEVEAGQTVMLECAATGEPPPEVAWHKDGGNDFPAATERRMHVYNGDDRFFIVSARSTDAGIYSCTAHNLAGKVTADARLEVLQKPQIANGPEDRELAAGEHIVLQCMAQGVPKPTITWYKDGEQIVATERHFLIAESQLMIIMDSVHNDSGIYECHLNNSQGEVVGYSRIVIKPNVLDTGNVLGIVIITVACCAVLTSICWVCIIYHHRRSSRARSKALARLPGTELTEIPQDCPSERSSCKDSGTGDSARRSNDDLAEFSGLMQCSRSDHDRLNQIDMGETGD
ncbi:leucine-rich repeats and immunoglobulin-like domains protein 3 [Anthonomus grandis grandis]|uniref:leucine-rich repeats and immunoglobulin-like domains protein 3 n=1 Tax=Anthonomus grandis grandis TaxID=2921223 RepID=UPI0021665B62|nr:leucine-rich repeats and immunoglobulin-like domains protein 3 [Anthonomus grandis grandis]